MEASAIGQQQAIEYPTELAEYLEPRWYAAYTCAKHEKRVAEQLDHRVVPHFLPLYQTVRRWKDRRVQLQLPLFPGYVFVRIPLKERLHVLEIPSVVRLVGFGCCPTPLPEADVDAIRSYLARGHRLAPHPYLRTGRRVRIILGPLEGLEGILLRRKGNLRVVVSLDLIMRSVITDIDLSAVEFN